MNGHQELSAIIGTLSAMLRNGCPRCTGIRNHAMLQADSGAFASDDDVREIFGRLL